MKFKFVNEDFIQTTTKMIKMNMNNLSYKKFSDLLHRISFEMIT